MTANGRHVEVSSETLASPTFHNRPAPYLQSARGARRDAAARFRWSELTDKQKTRIRHAVPRLYEINGMGDTSVAELLFALGNAGILKDWGPGEGDFIGDENIGEIWSNGGGE